MTDSNKEDINTGKKKIKVNKVNKVPIFQILRANVLTSLHFLMNILEGLINISSSKYKYPEMFIKRNSIKQYAVIRLVHLFLFTYKGCVFVKRLGMVGWLVSLLC